MVKVELGQEVMTTSWQSRDPQPGKVVKVGRVWIDVDVDSFTLRYRLDTQTNGSQYGSPPRFYTLDQWAEKQREDEARDYLREQGIEFSYVSPWRRRLVELADLIRTVEEAGRAKGS